MAKCNRYVRLDERNKVVEIFVNTSNFNIKDMFPPYLRWIECPYDVVVPGWVYDSVEDTFYEGTGDPLSPDEILTTMRQAIQNHLDAKSKERLYDGILSLCTYATSTNPKFAAEGQAGVVWRDACWAKGYEIMAEVQAGTKEIPTVEELLAELPVFRWPDEVTP